MQPIKVLSLFDGISTGQLALERAGIPVETYYASEIDESAIKVAMKNYPNTIQLGDVTKIDFTDDKFKDIDLIIGGSPCFEAGTLVLTENGYKPIEEIQVGDRVLTHTGMYQRVLRTGGKIADTVLLGKTRVTLNHPYYTKRVDGSIEWVAVQDLTQTDMLFDVEQDAWIPYQGYADLQKDRRVYNLEVEIDNSYTADNIVVHNCQDLSNYKYDRGEVKGLEGSKSGLFYCFVNAIRTIKPKYFLLENVGTMQQKWADVISQELGVKPIRIQSALVSAAERNRLYWFNFGPMIKGLAGLPICNIPQPEDKGIVLKDIVETEIPDKYWYDKEFTFHGEDKKVIATIHLNGHRQVKEVYNLNHKCNTLCCDGNGGNLVKKVYQYNRIRKLMPIEYERLQNLPDNYTEGIADSRRYTAIGNGWTTDVIVHIFKYLRREYEDS